MPHQNLVRHERLVFVDGISEAQNGGAQPRLDLAHGRIALRVGGHFPGASVLKQKIVFNLLQQLEAETRRFGCIELDDFERVAQHLLQKHIGIATPMRYPSRLVEGVKDFAAFSVVAR